jgi:hypothetical protein
VRLERSQGLGVGVSGRRGFRCGRGSRWNFASGAGAAIGGPQRLGDADLEGCGEAGGWGVGVGRCPGGRHPRVVERRGRKVQVRRRGSAVTGPQRSSVRAGVGRGVASSEATDVRGPLVRPSQRTSSAEVIRQAGFRVDSISTCGLSSLALSWVK